MKKPMAGKGKKGNPSSMKPKKGTPKSTATTGINRPSKMDEKRWQAQDDARTLAQAQEISMDKKRMGMAVKEANMMAKEAEMQAMKMKNIGKGPMMENGKGK